MKRVLIVSHTYAVSARCEKIDFLAKSGQYQIGLAAPKSWSVGFDRSENNRESSDSDTPMYRSFFLATFFTGDFNRYFFEPFSLFWVFLRFRPHLVQVEQESWSASLFQLTVLAKLFRAKVIFFTWENIYKEWHRLFGFFERANLQLADGAVIGNSEAGDILRMKNFQKPITLIPQTGVDTNLYRRTTAPLNLRGLETASDSQINLGFVGRFDEAKGVKDLMTVFERFLGEDPSVANQLTLVGDGPLKDWLVQEITGKGLKDKVRIIPAVPFEQVPEFYSTMDILVVPSKKTGSFWKEQFGRVIIEAMACGVAVLGSSSGAIPEVIGEAGLVFKENDIINFSDKLKLLMCDSTLRNRLGQAGRQRVLENYTNEIIVQKTLSFWKQFL